MEVKQEKVLTEKITFSKVTILASEKYSHRSDLLNMLLKDSKRYTFEEVDKIIDSFMKGGK